MPGETTYSEYSDDMLDAVVLAGSGGAAKFATVDGATVPKACLEVGREPLVRRAVRAVLGARGVGKVFVVGEPASLGRILEPLQAGFAGRIEVVPEGRDILANCLRAFFNHLLPGRGFADAADLATDPTSIRAGPVEAGGHSAAASRGPLE